MTSKKHCLNIGDWVPGQRVSSTYQAHHSVLSAHVLISYRNYSGTKMIGTIKSLSCFNVEIAKLARDSKLVTSLFYYFCIYSLRTGGDFGKLTKEQPLSYRWVRVARLMLCQGRQKLVVFKTQDLLTDHQYESSILTAIGQDLVSLANLILWTIRLFTCQLFCWSRNFVF